MAHERGILYVACGMEYARVAAASARAAAEHVGLPIHVLTNCDAARYDWPDATTFARVDLPDEHNRLLRLTAHHRTPFERTLMLDADALITGPAAGLPFDYLDRFDLVAIGYRPLRYYGKCRDWDGMRERIGSDTISAVIGGALWWRRCWQIEEMFSRWRRYWEEDGSGRDMPALLRAIWESQVRLWLLAARDGWLDKRSAIIIHEVGQTVPGLPEMRRKLRPPQRPDGAWIWTETVSERRKRLKLPARPAIAHAYERLIRLDGEIVAVEIGVWKGDHAEQMLNLLQPKTLWLIDPWDAIEPDGEYGQWVRKQRGERAWRRWRDRNWNAVYETMRRRFAERANVRILRCRADQAAKPQQAHIVYLDGRKDFGGALNDMRIRWQRVAAGGVLGGHDYNQTEMAQAVKAFAAEIGIRHQQAEQDWWFDKPAESGSADG